MIKRIVRRVLSVVPAVAVTAAATAVLTAAPASASTVGERTGSGMSMAEILLVFVGIPALIFVLCAVFVYATEGKGDPRLREGQGWWSQPEYFSGDEAKAGAQAPSASTGPSGEGDEGTGGASARW